MLDCFIHVLLVYTARCHFLAPQTVKWDDVSDIWPEEDACLWIKTWGSNTNGLSSDDFSGGGAWISEWSQRGTSSKVHPLDCDLNEI